MPETVMERVIIKTALTPAVAYLTPKALKNKEPQFNAL